MTTATKARTDETTAADAADVKLAAAGDTRAFERLYRRHVARVHSLARRMLGGAADADEATQEVFVRAWRKLDTFRGDSAFGTWLHRIAITVILAHRKSASRLAARIATDEFAVAAAAQRPVRTDLRVDVEAAIEMLPDGAREVFVLYDVEGYRHEEIARRLGISVGTSKSQLHRARMLLRGLLKE